MADLIIYLCLAFMLALGVLSFFVAPLYEKGVWIVLGALSHTLVGACGFKFGVTIPGKQDDVANKPTDPTQLAQLDPHTDAPGSVGGSVGSAGNEGVGNPGPADRP